ncbi:MAG: hypothetical protein A2Y76_00050 [Planctomycetes bacterium RBG_13_60_9]|nr:MAG: hypothetical protein A2Y76_00050 [Planctomycetes bacterium RBG_13_60_9]
MQPRLAIENDLSYYPGSWGFTEPLTQRQRFGKTDGYVRGTEALFTEVLQTLLENAFKYTPDHGSIHLRLSSLDPA